MSNAQRLSNAGTWVLLLLLFSCDKDWEPFAHYYPRKHYPGRGEVVIQGEKLSGRFGYRRDNSKGKHGFLYISCVLPTLKRTSEWTINFNAVPAVEGTYGLFQNSLPYGSTCNRRPLEEQSGVTIASATGDIILDFYNPYCKDPSFPAQLKIIRISNGNVEGEFGMKAVNSSDSTDFITIRNGRFSSPEVRK